MQLVIKALRTHKQHAGMQRWGYKALRSLATREDLNAAGKTHLSMDKLRRGSSKPETEPLLDAGDVAPGMASRV